MNTVIFYHEDLLDRLKVSSKAQDSGMGDVPNFKSQKSGNISLSQRFVARLIDYQFIFLMYIAVDQLTYGTFSSDINWFSKNISAFPTQILTTLLLFLMFLGYFIIYHSIGGQTPGKYICSIRVSHSRTLISIGIFQNIIRETTWVFCLMLGGWLFIIMLFSKDNRGIHDWFALSTVTKA